jgi:citrate lyase beta subunit
VPGTDDDVLDVAARLTAAADDRLRTADADLARRFPGDRGGRQPVHTVYVPADRVTPDVTRRWGSEARQHLRAGRGVLEDLLGVEADRLLPLVDAKLGSEPVEDLRIDLEDGYGGRPEEEDGHATAAARALVRAQHDAADPPFWGVRCKGLEAPSRARGIRSLTIVVATVLEAGGSLDSFVVTLPKVTSVDQVRAMVDVCAGLERATSLPERTLRFEIQVETPQSVLGPDGTALVAPMVHAGDGRVTGLHYGTYDYSAASGVAAQYQSMEHPVADHARLTMQAAAAGTGVRLSDGSTNILPVGDDDQVRLGWATHLRLVRRSLERGFYQGWDLHPAQLPTRFAATYSFYRSGFDPAAARLERYLRGGGGAVLDEPATARALADFVVRGVESGAVTGEEATAATGATRERLTALARPRRDPSPRP